MRERRTLEVGLQPDLTTKAATLEIRDHIHRAAAPTCITTTQIGRVMHLVRGLLRERTEEESTHRAITRYSPQVPAHARPIWVPLLMQRHRTSNHLRHCCTRDHTMLPTAIGTELLAAATSRSGSLLPSPP